MKTKKAKENLADSHAHNILRLSDVCQILLSLQVKRGVVIDNKDGIDKLPK